MTATKSGTPAPGVVALLEEERVLGIDSMAFFQDFASQVMALRTKLRALLGNLKASNARIAAYGAAAKGTIMLNYLGVDDRVLEFAVDRNPAKQGRYIPGVNVPIVCPDVLESDPPDVLVLLPWNFRDEILRQQQGFIERGGRIVVPIPDLEIVAA